MHFRPPVTALIAAFTAATVLLALPHNPAAPRAAVVSYTVPDAQSAGAFSYLALVRPDEAQLVQGAVNAVAAIRYQQQQAAAQAAAAAAARAAAAQAAAAVRQAAAGAGAYGYLITTAYQACVVRAESGGNWMIWNPTGHWGWYQFAYGTWVSNGGDPALFGNAGPAYQTQIFWNTFRADGTQPWMSDGC